MALITGFLIDNGPQITTVTGAVNTVTASLVKTNVELAAMNVTLAAINVKLNTSLRGPAVGTTSATATYNYNVANSVITRRNALAGPTNQLPLPTPPVDI
jgi:3-oxoacyl-(acyl-carrier-protein) synthase